MNLLLQRCCLGYYFCWHYYQNQVTYVELRASIHMCIHAYERVLISNTFLAGWLSLVFWTEMMVLHTPHTVSPNPQTASRMIDMFDHIFWWKGGGHKNMREHMLENRYLIIDTWAYSRQRARWARFSACGVEVLRCKTTTRIINISLATIEK